MKNRVLGDLLPSSVLPLLFGLFTETRISAKTPRHDEYAPNWQRKGINGILEL